MSKINTVRTERYAGQNEIDAELEMSMLSFRKNEAKAKQVVVRFDNVSYNKICQQAKAEHRGLGEFVRHATLDYIERIDSVQTISDKRGGQ